MLTNHERTASVRFRNCTTINVAKIEGSRAYKAAVRDAIDFSRVDAFEGDDTAPQDYPLDTNITPIPQTVLGTRSLRDHLPPWLGGKPATPDATQAAFQAMLHVLSAAMESYLDVNIHNASIAPPFPIKDSTREHIQAACAELGLQQRLHLAPQIATWAYHIPKGNFCPEGGADYRDELALGVDSSEAALTAKLFVWDFEHGVMDTYRVLHSSELGARQLFTIGNWRERFIDAIHEVTVLPLGDELLPERDYISQLVLFGDSVGDIRSKSALREALSDGSLNASGTYHLDIAARTRDPAYIAATGAAAAREWRNNDEDFCSSTS